MEVKDFIAEYNKNGTKNLIHTKAEVSKPGALDSKEIANFFVEKVGGADSFAKHYSQWGREYNETQKQISGIQDGYSSKDVMKDAAQKLRKLATSGSIYNYVNTALGGKSIPNFAESLNKQINALEERSAFYSQWETEEEYNDALAAQEEYDKNINYDTKSAQKEIDEMLSGDEITSLNNEKQKLHNNIKLYHRGVRTTYKTYKEVEAAQERISAIEKEIEDIQKNASNKQAELTKAKRFQEAVKLAEDALNAVDFKKYSSANTDYADDRTYKYINDIDDFRSTETSYWSEHSTYTTDSGMVYPANIPKYMESNFEYMKDDEIGIFNYYYSKFGAAKANEYLDSIQETLNTRSATKIKEDFGDNSFAKTLYGAVAGLDQFKSGIENLFNFSDDYIVPSDTQIASGMIREDLKDSGAKLPDWMGGGSIGQAGYDLITTTTNMAPSILTSAVVGMINPVAGQIVGAGLMGASASGNAYAEALNLGYDKTQARTYSVLVGASEAGLQYLLGGIGAMGGALTGKASTKIATKLASNVDKAFGKMLVSGGTKLVGNMVSEFGEEYLQEVLTPVFKNIALKTEEDVKLVSPEAFYAGFLGALSAGVLESGGTVAGEVGTYNSGKSVMEKGKTNDLVNLGKSFSTDTIAYQIASKIDGNTDAYTLGQLLNEAGAGSLTESNMAEIQKSLERKGVTPQDAQTIAKWLNKAVEGRYFTNSQIEALSQNEVISATFRDVILNQKSTVNQRVQRYQDILESLEQENANSTEATATPANADATVGAVNDTVSGTATEDVSNAYTPTSKVDENGRPITAVIDGVEVDLKTKQPVLNEPNLTDTSGTNTSLAQDVDNVPFMHTDEHTRVENIADKLGMTLRWSSKIGEAGLYSNGVIYLNPHCTNPKLQIFKHEFTHYLENSRWYKSFVTYLKSTQVYQEWVAKKGGEAAYTQQLKDNYAAAGHECNPDHEIVANFVAERVLGGVGGFRYDANGKLVNYDPVVMKALSQFAETHQTWYDAILTHIKDIAAKLKSLYYSVSGKTAAQQSESQELDEIYRRLVQLKDTVNTKKSAQSEGQFMIKTDINGNKFVDVEPGKIKERDGKSIAQVIAEIISNKFNNLIDVSGQKIRINQHTNLEFRESLAARKQRDVSNEMYSDKLQTIQNADEILKAAKEWIGEQPHHTRKDDIVEFASAEILYRVGQNGYAATVLVGTKKDGSAVLHDIVQINAIKITEPLVTKDSKTVLRRQDDPVTNDNISQANSNVKQKQFEIVQSTNPMWDDYHTGIRMVEDIRTWEEVLQLDDEREGQFVWGDFSREDAEKALKENSITVYSSHPIENGTFVSTSYVQAQEYAGGASGGEVYSKTIALDEVAWINGDEGQYANVNEGKPVTKPNGQAYVSTSRHSDLYKQYKAGEITREQYQAKMAARNGNYVTDADYMDAVNRGDMETAQSIVYEAAKEAGYTQRLFHGTDQFGYTKFEGTEGHSYDEIQYFATDSLETASSYAYLSPEVRRISSTQGVDLEAEAKKHASDMASFMSKEIGDDNYINRETIMKAAASEEDFALRKICYQWLKDVYESKYSKEYKNRFKKRYKSQEDFASSDKAKQLKSEALKLGRLVKDSYDSRALGIYEFVANTDNLFVLDGKGKQWNELEDSRLPENRQYKTREVCEWAKEKGYSGVLFKNIIDSGLKVAEVSPANVYAFFNPREQVKSADPVTYDNDGNVIPLSERFNKKNDDMRYFVDTNKNTELFKQYEQGKLTREQYQAEMVALDEKKTAEVRRLRQQTATQKTALEQIRNAFKNTHGAWNENRMLEVLRGITKGYPTKTAATKLIPAYAELLTYIQNHPRATVEELEAKAIDLVANPILDSMKAYVSEEGAAFLADVKQMRFKLSDEQIAEIKYIYGTERAWRRSVQGKVRITNDDDAMSLDQAWKEMSELYPDRFDAEANPLDMPALLDDIITVAAEEISPFEYMPRETMAREIALRAIGGYHNVPKVILNADKVQREINLEREKNIKLSQSKKRAQLRQQVRSLYTDFKKRLFNANDNVYVPEEFRQVVCDVLDGLTYIVSDGNKESVSKKLKLLSNELANIKAEGSTFGREFMSEDFLEDAKHFSGYANAIANTIAGKDASELTIGELQDIVSLCSDIKYALQHATAIIRNGRAESLADAADSLVKQQETVSEKEKINWFNRENLNPLRIALRMGEYNEDSVIVKLFRDIEQGYIKQARFQADSNKRFEEVIAQDPQAYEKMCNEVIEWKPINSERSPVRMTKMQAMQILMTYDRERNGITRHLEQGGARIADAELVLKGKYEEAKAKAQKLIVTEGAYNSIKEQLFSSNDANFIKDYWDVAYEQFNHYSRDAINEVSMQRQHRMIATTKNYIPMVVDGDYVEANLEGVSFNYSLANTGSLKSVERGAVAPVMIEGLNFVVRRNIDTTAKIHGLLIPVENCKKVINQTTDTGVKVHGVLSQRWGAKAYGVIEQVLVDVQKKRTVDKPTKNSDYSELLKIAERHFITAVLAGRATTVVSQFSAYFSAGAYIEQGHLLKTLKDLPKNSINYEQIEAEIDAHTPLHMERRDEITMPELRDIVSQDSFVKKSFDKLNDKKGLWALNLYNQITRADRQITRLLWLACKSQVNAKTPKSEVGTDSYWKEVTALYERVILDTQSTYSPLHRAEVSKTLDVKKKYAFGFFKTEPLQHYGTMHDAYHKMKVAKRKGNAEMLKSARKQFARTVVSQVEIALSYTLLKLVAGVLTAKLSKRWRDDDEELTAESISKELGRTGGEALLSSFLPMTSDIVFSIGEALYGIISGEGVEYYASEVLEIPSFAQFNDLLDSFYASLESAGDMFDEESDKTPEEKSKKLLQNLRDMAEIIGNFTGIPIENIGTIFDGVYKHATAIIKGEDLSYALDMGVERSNAIESHRMYEALIEGDTEKYNEIYESLIAKGLTKTQIKNGIASIIADTNPKVADAAKISKERDKIVDDEKSKDKYNELTAQLNSYILSIAGEGRGDIPIEFVTKAVELKVNELDGERLSDDEKSRIESATVKLTDKYTDELKRSAYYKDATPLEQSAMSSEVEKYANAVAKADVDDEYKLSNDYTAIHILETEDDVSVVELLVLYETADTDEDGKVTVKEYTQAISQSNQLNSRQKQFLISLKKAKNDEARKRIWDNYRNN